MIDLNKAKRSSKMFIAKATKQQAKEIADFISERGMYASNCDYSATSTRITSTFLQCENSENGIVEIYSNYTHENVIDELPDSIKENLSFNEMTDRDVELYLHYN